MQDFAEHLRQVRAGPDQRFAQSPGQGQQHSHPIDVFANGYTLGYQKGSADREPDIARARDAARLVGHDAAVRTLLVATLEALQEVVGELESRRAHKVMVERARGRLNELVSQLGAVGEDLPEVPKEQLAMESVLQSTAPFYSEGNSFG